MCALSHSGVVCCACRLVCVISSTDYHRGVTKAGPPWFMRRNLGGGWYLLQARCDSSSSRFKHKNDATGREFLSRVWFFLV